MHSASFLRESDFENIAARPNSQQYNSNFIGKLEFNPNKYISLTAFSVTFIAIIIAISLLGKLLTKIANFAALGMVNKLLGGLFGMLKVGIIVSVLLIFITKVNATIPFIKKEILIDSLLYKPLKNIVPTLLPFIDDNALDEIIVKKSQNNTII